MTVSILRFYMPRLSDSDLDAVAWMAGKFSYQRCRKLAIWTLGLTHTEAKRRSDPDPVEVSTPVLPVGQWTDAELASATDCTWLQSQVSESQHQGEFYDELLFCLMAEATARLKGFTT